MILNESISKLHHKRSNIAWRVTLDENGTPTSLQLAREDVCFADMGRCQGTEDHQGGLSSSPDHPETPHPHIYSWFLPFSLFSCSFQPLSSESSNDQECALKLSEHWIPLQIVFSMVRRTFGQDIPSCKVSGKRKSKRAFP